MPLAFILSLIKPILFLIPWHWFHIFSSILKAPVPPSHPRSLPIALLPSCLRKLKPPEENFCDFAQPYPPICLPICLQVPLLLPCYPCPWPRPAASLDLQIASHLARSSTWHCSSPVLLVLFSILDLSHQCINMLSLFPPFRYKLSLEPFSAISCEPIFLFSSLGKLFELFSVFPVVLFSSHIPLWTHLIMLLLYHYSQNCSHQDDYWSSCCEVQWFMFSSLCVWCTWSTFHIQPPSSLIHCLLTCHTLWVFLRLPCCSLSASFPGPPGPLPAGVLWDAGSGPPLLSITIPVVSDLTQSAV